MQRVGKNAEIRELRRQWQQWTATVEMFARGHWGRRWVDPGAYMRLHQELLESCRQHANAANGTEKSFFETLEELAQPWMTPRSLTLANREILMDLLLRCQRAGKQLGARTWTTTVQRWSRRFLVFLGIGVLMMVFWHLIGHKLWDWVWLEARFLFPQLLGWTEGHGWLIAGIVVLALAMYLLSRIT